MVHGLGEHAVVSEAESFTQACPHIDGVHLSLQSKVATILFFERLRLSRYVQRQRLECVGWCSRFSSVCGFAYWGLTCTGHTTLNNITACVGNNLSHFSVRNVRQTKHRPKPSPQTFVNLTQSAFFCRCWVGVFGHLSQNFFDRYLTRQVLVSFLFGVCLLAYLWVATIQVVHGGGVCISQQFSQSVVAGSFVRNCQEHIISVTQIAGNQVHLLCLGIKQTGRCTFGTVCANNLSTDTHRQVCLCSHHNNIGRVHPVLGNAVG